MDEQNVDTQSVSVEGSSLSPTGENVLEQTHSEMIDDSSFEGSSVETPQETPAQEESAEDGDEWYSHIEGLVSQGNAPVEPLVQTPQPTPQPNTVPNKWVDAERFEEMLTDPEALNRGFEEVFQRAREQVLMDITVPQIAARADSFFNARPEINTPAVRQIMANAAIAIHNQYPEAPLPDVLSHAERYVEHFAKKNPHKVVSVKRGLPPLPGTPAAANLKSSPQVNPANVVRPTFPGGGGSARRTVPQQRSLDPLQSALDSMNPEDMY